MRVKARLEILWIYLRTGILYGPGEVHALWRRSNMREQRFRSVVGRLPTLEEIKPVIDKQLWYREVLHRDPSEEELDQIIKDVMAWQLRPDPGRNNVSEDEY